MRVVGKMAGLGLAAGWVLLASASLALAEGATAGGKTAETTAAATRAVPTGIVSADNLAPWFIVGAIWIVALVAAFMVRASLGKNSTGGSWLLADALSEPDTIIATDGANGGTAAPRLVASSSRLIAMLGLLVILILFLAIGSAVVLQLLYTGQTPDLAGITQYFFGGVALFIPYMANQVKDAIAALGPKK